VLLAPQLLLEGVARLEAHELVQVEQETENHL
jgi:hypothetical protein